ncbi:hypothetical protein PFICI_00418 [Pestalotiopsis fici W106-1]|uniref:BZIP domain-containing protein n=1 Tax=Pestalotiopsis fici (strain W106-1 / CGMCC3.15140) TaxID=1229662 RepID=W3XKR5_PESFW|nr:uncharacterized protein PFICI_00418 [Pestalotiopsis fici W106-1]ETS86590.1 hypothetical protein PFICI_00418 [Pestalotiopsis fici W106-1]
MTQAVKHAHDSSNNTTADAGSSLSEQKHIKTPKPRNSEARKEQNRIASRAYREKRKQKLALLDQILNIEDTDAASSPSDIDGISQGSLSVVAQSREPSQSPVPATTTSLATAPPVLSWLSTSSNTHLPGESLSLDMTGGGGGRGGEAFGSDMWFTEYEYTDSTINNNNNNTTTLFGATDHQDFMTTPAYPNHHAHQYTADYATSSDLHHHHIAPSTPPQTCLDTGAMYDTTTWLSQSKESPSETPVAAALAVFSHLSPTQQDQMLEIIYKQRGILGTTSLNNGVNCPATPPSDLSYGPRTYAHQYRESVSKSNRPRSHYQGV